MGNLFTVCDIGAKIAGGKPINVLLGLLFLQGENIQNSRHIGRSSGCCARENAQTTVMFIKIEGSDVYFKNT